MQTNHIDVAIVGAGIVGLAHAYMAAKNGHKVGVFERNGQALGATIRNFGMIWPIGQKAGKGLERALRSRRHWCEISDKIGSWLEANGSLHLAYHQDELDLLDEFISITKGEEYECALLTPSEITRKSYGVQEDNLLGGLWSSTELLVDPRTFPSKLAEWLAAVYSVNFYYHTNVDHIEDGILHTPTGEWMFDHAFICCGDDFQTLYPHIFLESSIIKSKLQMMKTASQPYGWTLGPSLCGGLTMAHYESFSTCHSLAMLKRRLEKESPQLTNLGIHVMVNQNAKGQLIIGDSHEYGWSFDPFIKEDINKLIWGYLHNFAKFPIKEIEEKWYGVYAKYPHDTEFVRHPSDKVTIVTGLGGSGMTQSFGLAEELINRL